MNAAELTEIAIYLIRDYLQSTLPQELNRIAEARADYRVALGKPANYFISEKKNILKLPAVFLIADYLDFALERGPNHPNALLSMNLTCVCEDKDEDNLTIKTYRYQAALYSVLHGAQLTSASGDMKLVIKVMQANYSPVYTAADENTYKGVFMKEVSLAIEANLFENLG